MTFDALSYFVNLLVISIVALPIYHAVRTPLGKQCLSIFLGLWMLYIMSPAMAIYWPIFWVVVWAGLKLLGSTEDERSKSSLLLLCILVFLLPMLTWKFYPEWFEFNLSRTLQSWIMAISPTLAEINEQSSLGAPIGLSFATFRALDLLVCVHIGLAKPPTIREALHYGLFAPIQFIGPITQFSQTSVSALDQQERYQRISSGIFRIAIGFGKLYFLAIPLASSQLAIIGFDGTSDISQWKLLSATVLFAWYIYFNFAAYTDMAVGISSLYGFKIDGNFNFPYFRPNLQQFWANWHMSLSGFAQRNIFVPLGGFRAERQHVATFATMMVIALWHGIGIPMLIYGTLHGCALIALRLKHKHMEVREGPLHYAIGVATTFGFVMITAPLLVLDLESVAPFYMRVLFGQ